MTDIFKEGNIVECVYDKFTNLDEGRRYEVGETKDINGDEKVILFGLDKTDGTKLKADINYIKISEDSFTRDGYFHTYDDRDVQAFVDVDDRVKGRKSGRREKEKVKVGIPQKKFTAHKDKGSNYGYTLRRDSAMKLILNYEGWEWRQTMKFDGMTDASRTLDQDFSPVDEESREYIRERIDKDMFKARVRMEDGEPRLKVSNYASTSYEFRHPKLTIEQA